LPHVTPSVIIVGRKSKTSRVKSHSTTPTHRSLKIYPVNKKTYDD